MTATSEITKAVGAQVMDCLNGAGTGAAQGTELKDGSYEFLLSPVYMPHDEISITAPTEKRSLLVNLRLEDQERPEPRHVRWMMKAGEGYREIPEQPTQAIVIESIDAPHDERVLVVFYHLSV